MIIADSNSSIKLIKAQFGQHFEIIDLGQLNWLLGIKITQDRALKTILLTQEAYIEEIITHFGLENACIVDTPMEPGVDLSEVSTAVSSTQLSPTEKTKYCKMISSLTYITVMI